MHAEIVISGNVGQHVEWKEDERFGGRSTFSVAVTPSVQRNGEWQEQETTWYRITCWRRLAVHVRDSVKKGDPIIVGGKLRLNKWVNEDNVVKHDFAIEARWVGHDLRRGSGTFVRSRVRNDPTEPFESDVEAARAEHERLRLVDGPGGGEAFDEEFERIDPLTGEISA